MSKARRSPTRLRSTPRPVRKVGKSERTRAAILDSAFASIWSSPFRDMTVNSLMASTDLSRPTFYQHFSDLHEVMETLLDTLQEEILVACEPWLSGVGDPVSLIQETMTGLIRVSYRRGPFLRAISDAATADERFEKAWMQFLGGFDDAARARIEADQKQGLIPDFDARPVAFALNRLDAYTLIHAFGKRPRSRMEPVREALARIWISTLYGVEWVEQGSSNLIRR